MFNFVERAALTAFLFAMPLARGLAESCPGIGGPQDVLACVVQNHPDVIRARVDAEQALALGRAARRRPPPELDAESAFPSDPEEPSMRLQAAYLHTWELGGKRGKRLQEAQAQGALLSAALQRASQDVALQTVLHLHRLRQVETELTVVQEALDAFGKIIRQYGTRPRLAPEQDVSLSVFVLAQSEHELRRAALLEERNRLREYFDLAAGLDPAVLLKSLPPRREIWPDLGSSAPDGGAVRQEAQAAVALAESRLQLARSMTAPDVKAGPFVDVESGRGQGGRALGAALSFPLPIYGGHQGGWAVAEADLQNARVRLELCERRLQSEWSRWRRTYAITVESLRKALSTDQVEKRHRDMEGLFERGLVSAALVIEAHRQMVDLTASRNAQELRAVEALWAIYALEGRILQEKI